MRTKVKHLKKLMLFGGFLESKVKLRMKYEVMGCVDASTTDHEGMRGDPKEENENVTSVQDYLEDLKRSITEVVECWNIL